MALLPDGLRRDAGDVQLQLLCGAAIVGCCDLPRVDSAHEEPGVYTHTVSDSAHLCAICHVLTAEGVL